MSTEQELVVCRKHWSAYIPMGFVAFVFISLALSGLLSGEFGVSLGILAVGALVCGLWVVSIRSNHISLSRSAISGKAGLIKSVKLVAPISRVQNLSISNGLGGKIFGYHDVTVATAGTSESEIVFRGVTNAKQLQKKYLELANQVRYP